jgi:hypothetical protein
MFPSTKFLQEVEMALQIASHNAQELVKAAGDEAEPSDFIRVGEPEAASTRRRRRSLLVEAAAPEPEAKS